MFLEMYFQDVLIAKWYFTPTRFRNFWKSCAPILLKSAEPLKEYRLRLLDGIHIYNYTFGQKYFLDVVAKILARVSTGKRVYNVSYLRRGMHEHSMVTQDHNSLMKWLKQSVLKNQKEFPEDLRYLNVWIEKNKSNVFVLKIDL
jgi:hypothetical protein